MKSESTWCLVARPLAFVDLTNFRFVGYRVSPLRPALHHTAGLPFRKFTTIHIENKMPKSKSKPSQTIDFFEPWQTIDCYDLFYTGIKKNINKQNSFVAWKYQKKCFDGSSTANSGCVSAKTWNRTRFM